VSKLPDVVTQCIASLSKLVRGKKPSCSITDLVPEVKVRSSPSIPLSPRTSI